MKPLHALLCLALAAAGWTAGRRWHPGAAVPAPVGNTEPVSAPLPASSSPAPRGTPGLAEKLKELAALPSTPDTIKEATDFLQDFPPADLPVVQAWYAGLPKGELKDAVLAQLLPVLARHRFPDACALVNALPADNWGAPRSRTEFQLRLVEEFGADQTPASRESRLASFPAADQPALRAAFQLSRFGELAWVDPVQAFSQLASLPEESRAPAVWGLFVSWVHSDPAGAAPHLLQLPPELQDEVLPLFTREWGQLAPRQVAAWVDSFPEGPRKQAAIVGLVHGLSEGHPVDAVAWAARLADPEARAEALKTAWLGTGPYFPEAVRAAVVALPLPPKEKAPLLQSPSLEDTAK